MQPVVITRNGRDRTGMISIKEYERLRTRDCEILGIGDFTDAGIETVRRAEPSPQADALNYELES